MSKTKNWINFCGVSSESIAGLLINELPAIQMTPKRINKIEIEGRDGDIIEELGYMAFDKPVQVSLTEGYDIDKVISWLNNSGPIIFSNEPNKVYTATVYDTVAFERLIRCRKASVKFHVQPFKTLLNDEQTFTTASGDFQNLSIVNTGNIYSQPIIEAEIGTTKWVVLRVGNDSIAFNLNVEEGKTYTATFNLADTTYIVKDNEGATVELFNVAINIEDRFLKLKPGENNVTLMHRAGFSSDMTSMTIKNVSRWL